MAAGDTASVLDGRRISAGRWPVAEADAARDLEHTARRQRAYLIALAAFASAWWLARVHTPRTLVVSLLVLAVVGAAVESLIALVQHERQTALADELIERGGGAFGRPESLDRLVDERVADLETEPHRHALARSLRWYIELERRCRTIGGTRATAIPPIRGFDANADLVERIAGAVDAGGLDPRVYVRLTWLLTSPARLGDGTRSSLDQDADRVRWALEGVARLLGDDPFGGGDPRNQPTPAVNRRERSSDGTSGRW